MEMKMMNKIKKKRKKYSKNQDIQREKFKLELN